MLKKISSSVKSIGGVLLVLSIVANVGLGILNFVFQPIWRASAVASAIVVTKTKEEAKTKIEVSKAKAKEKAKGRIRRVAVAIPLGGTAFAAWFEYGDYQEWQKVNPNGTISEYSDEAIDLSQQLVDEALVGLPASIRPDSQSLLKSYKRILDRIPD